MALRFSAKLSNTYQLPFVGVYWVFKTLLRGNTSFQCDTLFDVLLNPSDRKFLIYFQQSGEVVCRLPMDDGCVGYTLPFPTWGCRLQNRGDWDESSGRTWMSLWWCSWSSCITLSHLSSCFDDGTEASVLEPTSQRGLSFCMICLMFSIWPC